MAFDWASIIAGGATQILPGLLERDENRKYNAEQMDLARIQMANQKEFAQHGVRWKVDDAKAAGLHPLAALGASTASYSPVSVGTMPDNSMSKMAANMGQNITRAISQTQTQSEKEYQALQIQSAKLDLEGKALDNQIRARQLQNTQPSGPSFPGADNFIPGQGNSGVKVKPRERSASQAGRPAQEAGWAPDVTYSRTDSGLAPAMPQQLAESMEDDPIGKFQWRMRNQFIPNINPNVGKPARSQLPDGAYDWHWSMSGQEWQPVYPGQEPYFYNRYQWTPKGSYLKSIPYK